MIFPRFTCHVGLASAVQVQTRLLDAEPPAVRYQLCDVELGRILELVQVHLKQVVGVGDLREFGALHHHEQVGYVWM